MLIVDDILIKPFMSILDIFQSMALREMYDVASIKDEMKENQLLFEIGDRSESEYERRKTELEDELNVAERIHEQLSGRVEVKGQ